MTKGVGTGRYRWVVLALFMLAAAANQSAWINFAPITSQTAQYYGVTDLAVGLLSLVFMVVYIAMARPGAGVIDTMGFRAAVGIGSILTALGALGRGLFSGSFTGVFVSQVVIALGQPLVVASITKLAARWFDPGERATAAGLGTLAMYLGILIGLVATPPLVSALGMKGMLLCWGVAAAAISAAFITFTRERPAARSSQEKEEPTLVFTGLKNMMGNRDFLMLLAIFFVGLGMFNAVTTWIEQILGPRGFTAAQASAAGGMMIGGGIAGALVMPLLSDSVKKRVPFLTISLAGIIPCLLGVMLARSYPLLLASGFGVGFFLLSSGPIGFQYAAEITRPAPEGTSNSLLLLMGQISGIVFILLMDAARGADGSMLPSLIGLVVLTAGCLAVSLFLREPKPAAPAGRKKGSAPRRTASVSRTGRTKQKSK